MNGITNRTGRIALMAPAKILKASLIELDQMVPKIKIQPANSRWVDELGLGASRLIWFGQVGTWAREN